MVFLQSVQWFEWMDVIDSLFRIRYIGWRTDSVIMPKHAMHLLYIYIFLKPAI